MILSYDRAIRMVQCDSEEERKAWVRTMSNAAHRFRVDHPGYLGRDKTGRFILSEGGYDALYQLLDKCGLHSTSELLKPYEKQDDRAMVDPSDRSDSLSYSWEQIYKYLNAPPKWIGDELNQSKSTTYYSWESPPKAYVSPKDNYSKTFFTPTTTMKEADEIPPGTTLYTHTWKDGGSFVSPIETYMKAIFPTPHPTMKASYTCTKIEDVTITTELVVNGKKESIPQKAVRVTLTPSIPIDDTYPAVRLITPETSVVQFLLTGVIEMSAYEVGNVYSASFTLYSHAKKPATSY